LFAFDKLNDLMRIYFLVVFGSCLLLSCAPEQQGCTDLLALNYSEDAVDDDGSCVYIVENCYDGILNNGEELVDCGGPCEPCFPCENGQWDPLLGEQWVDCGGPCDPCEPSFNGVQDPGESGIDCGGDTGIPCGELCGDGLLNGSEQAVDCGGPNCEPC
jgi:hypothetical protein